MRHLPDSQRFPLLSERGQSTLTHLREHPQAPRWTFPCGDRLDEAGLQSVRDFEAHLQSQLPIYQARELPDWLPSFVGKCLAEVPFYRARGGSIEDFWDLPTCHRADLAREPWNFVPDAQLLDELIIYRTSGTTGSAVSILSHPVTASMYLPIFRRLLEMRDLRLEGATPQQPNRISIALICLQTSTYTHATISSFLNEAGFVKLNLNPSEWKSPADRARFLDDCAPEIFSGDPLSLLELTRLDLKTRPKAIISSATALLSQTLQELEAHFGCPIIDLYSTNETGPIAHAVEHAVGVEGHAHELICPDLFVEIVRPDGSPCDEGERGEIVVSGGRNPFLPLLRYRTGDFASMRFRPDAPPLLLDFEGRAPVLFRTSDGRSIPNIDITHALRDLHLVQFSLHQNADSSLRFRWRGSAQPEQIQTALQSTLGHNLQLALEPIDENEPIAGKLISYSSDMAST